MNGGGAAVKRRIIVLGAVATASILMHAGAVRAQGDAQTSADPVKMALARQLVEQNGGQQAIKAQIDAMFNIMKANIGATAGSDQAAMTNQIYEDLQSEMDGLLPQLIDIDVKIYARNYTEKEMRDILAFEQSETGQSMRSKALKIRSEAMNETMPLVLGLMPAILRHTADRVCETSHCNAKERELVAAVISKALEQVKP